MEKAKENLQSSNLLVNPNLETQVKDKPIKKVPRVIFITLLSLLILIGYIFGFSGSLYPSLSNKCYIGVLDKTQFKEVSFGDLCVVKKVDKIASVKESDMVFYVINGKIYSGVVENVNSEVVVVNGNNGNISVSKENLMGVLESKIAVLGFFVGLICSYYGAILFSLILFAYLCIITIRRINYENTEKGRTLRDKYLKNKKEKKRTKAQGDKLHIHSNNSLLQVVGADVISTISNIKNLTNNKKNFETYELIVNEAHEKLIPAKKLTKEDKQKITILVELCVCFNRIDLEIEYKLVDLILKTKLTDFNKVQFLENSKKLIAKGTEETLFNFISILYVLISKNSALKTKEIKQILTFFNKELRNRNYPSDSRCVKILAKTKEML